MVAGTIDRMTDWATHLQAVEFFGCLVSNVPNLITKGHLRGESPPIASCHPSPAAGLSKSLRRGPMAGRARRDHRARQTTRPGTRVARPANVGELLGLSKPGVLKRIQRGQHPDSTEGASRSTAISSTVSEQAGW
jgi:hypothetical protein